MGAIKHLLRRPLGQGEISDLASDDRLDVTPYGGMQTGGEFRIYALKLATGARACAFGFDTATREWQQLSTVEMRDLAEADDHLDPILDQWVLEHYGDQFEVVKPA